MIIFFIASYSYSAIFIILITNDSLPWIEPLSFDFFLFSLHLLPCLQEVDLMRYELVRWSPLDWWREE